MIDFNYIRMVRFSFMFLVSIGFVSQVEAQHYYLPLQHELNARYDSSLNRVGSPFHTSIKPYAVNELRAAGVNDTVDRYGPGPFSKSNSRLARKLFREHLLEIRGEDYQISVDPVVDFTMGYTSETDTSRATYINARGIQVDGYFGKGFSFQSRFVETQAEYPGYVDSAIRATSVVPGGGRTKKLYGGFDFGVSSGSVSYALPKYFSFQLGYDKNFIGDGYRSLLLSDNSYHYPFFKINANFWKIKYMVLYTMFLDGPDGKGEDRSYRRKYGTFHYLDINIGKRLTVGLLESIIWKYDSTRAYDLSYLNPVLFLRPVEFSIGSPDNALLGLNLKYKLAQGHHLYGQIILDEFKISEVRTGDGWWANKHGFQLGWRSFGLLGIRNLDVFAEWNYVRPYTYQHRSSLTSYAHFNQPLAHPMGANFSELLASASYSKGRWKAATRFSMAEVGYDIDANLNPVNFGNNVLLSYETHPSDYGNTVGQGLNTDVLHLEAKLSYLVNPSSNLYVEGGVQYRNAQNVAGESNTQFFYLGIKNLIGNRYFDF